MEKGVGVVMANEPAGVEGLSAEGLSAEALRSGKGLSQEILAYVTKEFGSAGGAVSVQQIQAIDNQIWQFLVSGLPAGARAVAIEERAQLMANRVPGLVPDDDVLSDIQLSIQLRTARANLRNTKRTQDGVDWQVMVELHQRAIALRKQVHKAARASMKADKKARKADKRAKKAAVTIRPDPVAGRRDVPQEFRSCVSDGGTRVSLGGRGLAQCHVEEGVRASGAC